MSDDLIRRMQVLANDMERSAPEEWDEHEDVMEAADYIARLTAELAEARAEKEAAYAVGFAAGVERAAKFIDRRLADYVHEYGSYDGTTGVTEFPGNGQEWTFEQEETAEAIRSLTPPDVTKAAARVLLADVANIRSLWLAFDPCGELESVCSEPLENHTQYFSVKTLRALAEGGEHE